MRSTRLRWTAPRQRHGGCQGKLNIAIRREDQPVNPKLEHSSSGPPFPSVAISIYRFIYCGVTCVTAAGDAMQHALVGERWGMDVARYHSVDVHGHWPLLTWREGLAILLSIFLVGGVVWTRVL